MRYECTNEHNMKWLHLLNYNFNAFGDRYDKKLVQICSIYQCHNMSDSVYFIHNPHYDYYMHNNTFEYEPSEGIITKS